MDDIVDLLGREVAGMPAWAWLVAVAGGLGVSWYMSTTAQGDSSEGADSAETDDDEGSTGADAGMSSGVTRATLTVPPVATSGSVQGTSEPDTNQAWVSEAVALAEDRGYSPSRGQQVATAILSGQTLPAGSRELADLLLSTLGAPPGGAPTIDYADSEAGGGPPADEDDPPDDEAESYMARVALPGRNRATNASTINDLRRSVDLWARRESQEEPFATDDIDVADTAGVTPDRVRGWVAPHAQDTDDAAAPETTPYTAEVSIAGATRRFELPATRNDLRAAITAWAHSQQPYAPDDVSVIHAEGVDASDLRWWMEGIAQEQPA